ncbi:MAG: tRNA dihydrouridine synthase DusB [Thermodesulfobacteriota bacterium]
MKIETVHIKNPFILAPLAGYCSLPYRILCLEYGAGLVYSEMISSHGLVYRQKKTLEMLKTAAGDQPVAMQLFGADPHVMGEAAAILAETDIDIIDINMGCPVKKVVKKKAGAALMKNPQLAALIIRSVVEKSNKPVTVKIRSGWDHNYINAVDFSLLVQDSGASALAVHGRTRSDGFGGRADWSLITRVKKAVSIPVMGNGDIISHEKGRERMRESGCDAVMIGRAAMGKPWIFREDLDDNSLQPRLKALKRHLELVRTYAEPEKDLAALRNQAARYFKGLPYNIRIREQIYRSRSCRELEDIAAELENGNRKVEI